MYKSIGSICFQGQSLSAHLNEMLENFIAHIQDEADENFSLKTRF